MRVLTISNRDARRLWLWSNALAETPTGPLDVLGTIKRLGFVQIDTIRNVTRAHNHILWSRNQNFREDMLWPLLGKNRAIFEHFTHDASLIPMDVLPMWQRQFRRLGAKYASHRWVTESGAAAHIETVRARIREEGPLSTHAFDSKAENPREMWARPPHKKALDMMWYAGELATCHRENFVKFYDLSERVFPAQAEGAPDERAQADWLCDEAMDRLSIATTGDVQRFWGAMSAAEARDWAARSDLVPVQVIGADGQASQSFAVQDIAERLARAPAPSSRLRLLNPFDPAIRDRLRLERLFGFEYRNEMFVPAADRRWGYYVYPLLEGDRFVGRIEVRADRSAGWLRVVGFWPEAGVHWADKRMAKLEAELARFARLAGVEEIEWGCSKHVL
ncbi:YcaQ family DNA glycosylase [Alphaproteobacteria bacterium KMM 3653]|uniref:YcaQ family DNA glycosylase n=1 Tax=Harenicola maris TaxID=2841044 RepID=A0AAP2CPU1_9RHOB|nr:YcaQ family DNA glycosylase [Harenicola maris]